MEKQWQNCGSDGTSIESTHRQKTIESASETVYTVSRLGLVCLSVLRRTYASSSRIGQNNTCFYRSRKPAARLGEVLFANKVS